MKKRLPHILVLVAALGCSASLVSQQATWTGSWAAAPVVAPANDTAAVLGPDGDTYRNIVHLSLGGKAIRLRISNEFGTTSLKLANAHVALSVGPASSATQPNTDHAVTFNHATSVVIPAGSFAVSDPVPMPVAAFADLAVSLFVPAQPGATLTEHALATSTNYVVPGDATAATTLDNATKVTHWYLLKGVDVDAGPRAASVVVLGASISDGYHSTPDKNLRWPDDLAARLHANPATAQIGVLNEGISGNRVLHDGSGPSALARLDRDVLAQPGAKYMIFAMGTNDIGRTFFPQVPNQEVTAEQIEWGLQQLVLRAHARGIKVLCGTFNPFEGAAFFSPAGDEMRHAVNTFIRTSGIFDGVIDFDRAMQDPAHPARFLPTYDSGDHLHPNDAGYKSMADAIDLKLFSK